MATDNSHYAVKIGRIAGIYTTWDECKAQVVGFPSAIYKKFTTLHEAEAFMDEPLPAVPIPETCYAVRVGRVPGVYSTWDECKEQTVGYPKAIYKKFSTREEAIDFVNAS